MIHYIKEHTRQSYINDEDFDGLFKGRAESELNSTEYMIKFCRHKKYNFMTLENDLEFNLNLSSCTWNHDASNPVTEKY